ncbi:serine hydrolase domain-containing protein [Kitasatospora hibisci]|uniref:serine hydrolase domain-containing protein n=1 Tax=Kitasatospora hibisci TaxID=3369522 RepID=UPI003754B6DD
MTNPRRRPSPALRSRPGRAAAAAVGVAGLLAGAGCSGGAAPGPAAAGAATAVPAALSPSPTVSPTGSPTFSPSSPGSASAPGTVARLTPAVTARLDAAVQRVLNQASVPGVMVALTTPQDSYIKAFGVSDKIAGIPMVTGLNMRIGSETKTFTVTGVLRLVDQGRVGLDDPISRYVPEVPGGDAITLRQLANMRSGLFPYTSDQGFVQALLADPHREFTPQQLLSYAFAHPADFPPGTDFEYSNTNTVLLGLVVEKVSGQPLGTFLEQQVFKPADLGRTVFPVDASFPQPHARGYTDQTQSGAIEDATDWNPSWAWAAGAMISDLPDLQKWAKVLATGTLLKPATQAERLQTPPSGDPGLGYGLGLFVNHGWIGHNGSLPGYQSVAVYLPSAQATLVVLLNTDIPYLGSAPSTLFAKAITEIVSPGNVYSLPVAPSSGSPSGPGSSPALAAT